MLVSVSGRASLSDSITNWGADIVGKDEAGRNIFFYFRKYAFTIEANGLPNLES